MDSRKLSGEEIKEMKLFIISRSKRFEEPSILIEILDHFACKTEEILSEDKSISFRDAMQKAHHSFGVKGFAPIAAAWEAHTFKRYKAWRKQEIRNIVFSLHVLGISAFSLLAAKIFLMLNASQLLPTHGLEIMLPIMIIYSITVYPVITKKSAGNKHPLLYEKALEANYSIFVILVILIPLINDCVNISPVVGALVIGTLTMTFGINMILNRNMLKKVMEESVFAEKQLSML
ncbi:hypothetical protein F0919_06395 [Taibaiella lutea]|uniref:Uncharacterized protein n=1 Tax=Taibaiella lutea TaxID=2608001 RepID=A0A5M6CPS6_9BACT|nr:hypothetical protein [Taibaiella lutea]KAA5537298.1 hypothetical protein F0919_06395 [Taibaiella lutea]